MILFDSCILAYASEHMYVRTRFLAHSCTRAQTHKSVFVCKHFRIHHLLCGGGTCLHTFGCEPVHSLAAMRLRMVACACPTMSPRNSLRLYAMPIPDTTNDNKPLAHIQVA